MDKFPTFNDGDNVYVNSLGQRNTYSDTGPLGTAPPDALILAELTQAVVQQQTLETWVRDNSESAPFAPPSGPPARCLTRSKPLRRGYRL